MAYLLQGYEEKIQFFTFFFFINRKNIVIHLNTEALLLVSTFHLNLEMVPLSTQNLMFLFILKKVFLEYMYIQFSYGQLKALFTSGKLQKIIMLNYKNTTKENNRRSHERNLVQIGSFVFLEIVATCCIYCFDV